MDLKPNTSLPWFEQVLDLESRGKPTTPAAHDIAMEARRKATAHGVPQKHNTLDDDEIPF